MTPSIDAADADNDLFVNQVGQDDNVHCDELVAALELADKCAAGKGEAEDSDDGFLGSELQWR